MNRQRNVKIVATLGPASDSPEMIRALFDAGADVFRLNMSHGTHDSVRALHAAIRDVEGTRHRQIGILADLQGPKIRIGRFADGTVELGEGEPFRLDLDSTPGDATRVHLPHPEVLQAVQPGGALLLDDGKIRLQVEESTGDAVLTRVVVGGALSDRKGVNVPNAILPVSALTEKDRRDLEFLLELGVDWVALSFVQRPQDIDDAREIIGARAGVLAKIETTAAIDAIDGIISRADAIMVARGDLGVELPPEEVPGIQKRLIRMSREWGKPVVVATQMLESMIHSPVATRAEVSDVATAVYDGADAVMLSAESAAGEYPVEAVAVMDRIGQRVEADPLYHSTMHAPSTEPESTEPDAICAAAHQVGKTIHAKAIVTYTHSGSTAMRAARERPELPVVGLTPHIDVARRLTLVWGVRSAVTTTMPNFLEMVNASCRIAFRQGYAQSGDRIVVIAGIPFEVPGTTNTLRIAEVSDHSPPDKWVRERSAVTD